MRESVKVAQLKVKSKTENVSGVQLPVFDMEIDGSNGESVEFKKTNHSCDIPLHENN